MFRLSVVPRVGGILLVLFLWGVAATETEKEQVQPKNGKAYELRTASWPDSGSTVYFYRYRKSQGGLISPGVYCDGVRLAKIANGSYFIANLDPGHHVFRTKGKKSVIEMDLADGQTYYIQVALWAGPSGGQWRLFVSDSVQDMGGLLPALPDPELGSIGLTVRTLSGGAAAWIYFVRLADQTDARGRGDAEDYRSYVRWLISTGQYVIRSNYHKKKQVYLLNAEPGRYAAVAANLDSVSQAFFSMEMIPLTEVTVGPGQIVFMGDFLVDLETGFENADEAQTHYQRLISPDADFWAAAGVRYGFGDVVFDSLVTGAVDKHGIHPDRLLPVVEEWASESDHPSRYYTARLDSVAKDAERERAFWGRARDKLFRKAPAWQKQVQRQHDALEEGGQ